MNAARVLIGGLVAGVVLNLGDFVINGFLMTAEMDLLRQRLNLNPDVLAGTGVLATWAVVDLLLGLLIVWTYAAIRPRFGPGPTTAMLAGLVPFASVTLVMIGLTQMGIFIMASTVKNSVFWLANMMIASLAGGYLYKE
ncbi:MAG: hypothetical protein R2752_02050 [Vicinamibacterales bacterium]